ncbi:hypothetical protein BH18ACT5_BH18ACT5_13620 [soil metagenome]
MVEKGPEWAIRHLRIALPVLTVMFFVAVVGAVWVRPLWVPIGVGYPALIGLVVGVGRSRQMVRVQKTGGFSEIDRDMRGRLLARYASGLIMTAVIAGGAGAIIVGAGYWQGAILVGLGLLMLLVRQRARTSA